MISLKNCSTRKKWAIGWTIHTLLHVTMHQAKQIRIAIILLLSVCQGEARSTWVHSRKISTHPKEKTQCYKLTNMRKSTSLTKIKPKFSTRGYLKCYGEDKCLFFALLLANSCTRKQIILITHRNKWTYHGKGKTDRSDKKRRQSTESPILWRRFDLSNFIAFIEGNLVVFRSLITVKCVRVDKSRLVKSNWLDSDVKSRRWWCTDDKAQEARLVIKHSRFIKENTQRRRRRRRWRSDFRWFLFVDFCLMYDLNVVRWIIT